VDNLVKFVLDSLNQKAYVDDSQVSAIKTAKFYTDDPGHARTVVKIRKLSEAEANDYAVDSTFTAAS
jgi:Holliday junction resolvase RusA-like endonuclease